MKLSLTCRRVVPLITHTNFWLNYSPVQLWRRNCFSINQKARLEFCDFKTVCNDTNCNTRCLVKLERKWWTFFLQVYEPTELERGFFTEKDQDIRAADIPERFQLRQVPVKPTEEGELEEEAEWIYKQAFVTTTVSQQV